MRVIQQREKTSMQPKEINGTASGNFQESFDVSFSLPSGDAEPAFFAVELWLV